MTHNPISQNNDNHFYTAVCAYVRGEPNGIVAGTVGEEQAEIAKRFRTIRRSWTTRTDCSQRSPPSIIVSAASKRGWLVLRSMKRKPTTIRSPTLLPMCGIGPTRSNPVHMVRHVPSTQSSLLPKIRPSWMTRSVCSPQFAAGRHRKKRICWSRQKGGGSTMEELTAIASAMSNTRGGWRSAALPGYCSTRRPQRSNGGTSKSLILMTTDCLSSLWKNRLAADISRALLAPTSMSACAIFPTRRETRSGSALRTNPRNRR